MKKILEFLKSSIIIYIITSILPIGLFINFIRSDKFPKYGYLIIIFILVFVIDYLIYKLRIKEKINLISKKDNKIEELEKMLDKKNNYFYKYNIKWDEDLNPHCPNCNTLMEGPTTMYEKSGETFKCTNNNCLHISRLKDKNGKRFYYRNIKNDLKEEVEEYFS